MGGDGVLATWLVVESNNEVALARLALTKARSEEVKKFAQKMVDDHTAFAQSLQPFADTRGTNDRGVGRAERGDKERDLEGNGRKGQPNEQKGQPNDASGVRASQPMGSFDHSSLIRDLGKKCQETAMKALQDKNGAEFDQCFMQMQVAGHEKAVGALEVFRKYASGELQPILDRGTSTMQAHLEHSKAVCATVCPAPKGEGTDNGDKR